MTSRSVTTYYRLREFYPMMVVEPRQWATNWLTVGCELRRFKSRRQWNPNELYLCIECCAWTLESSCLCKAWTSLICCKFYLCKFYHNIIFQNQSAACKRHDYPSKKSRERQGNEEYSRLQHSTVVADPIFWVVGICSPSCHSIADSLPKGWCW